MLQALMFSRHMGIPLCHAARVATVSLYRLFPSETAESGGRRHGTREQFDALQAKPEPGAPSRNGILLQGANTSAEKRTR